MPDEAVRFVLGVWVTIGASVTQLAAVGVVIQHVVLRADLAARRHLEADVVNVARNVRETRFKP